MAYTEWGAFNTFREKTVDLLKTDVDRARTSRNYLFDQLKGLSTNNYDFPMITSYYQTFGSFARNTKILPLDDVDIMVVFNGLKTEANQSTGDPYTYWLKIKDSTAPLAYFLDDYGYVNSTKLLNKMKSLLASVSNYSKAELKRNMQAVVLNLISYPWSFDIVPAVPIGDSNSTYYYLIPNGRGDWIRTDPRIDRDFAQKVNQKHYGKLLPSIRLLKYWNRRTHKPRLPSYYFETLTLKVFEFAPVISDFPNAMDYFFNNCPNFLVSSCPDPKNLGPNLDDGISWDVKNKIIETMKAAAEYSGYAQMYKRMSDDEKAIYWWGRIFGPEFPSYG